MLIATSPTMDGIKNSITRFYAGESKQLVQESPNRWVLWGARGKIPGVVVQLVATARGARYRFIKED